MSTRPEIELALDIRSYENVVVLCGEARNDYPEGWIQPNDGDELGSILNADSVVVIDKVGLQARTLTQIAASSPRLVAFAIADVEHEKQVRRMVTSLFPWNEMWTIFTSFGKLLVTKDVKGKPYDRGESLEEDLAA